MKILHIKMEFYIGVIYIYIYMTLFQQKYNNEKKRKCQKKKSMGKARQQRYNANKTIRTKVMNSRDQSLLS